MGKKKEVNGFKYRKQGSIDDENFLMLAHGIGTVKEAVENLENPEISVSIDLTETNEKLDDIDKNLFSLLASIINNIAVNSENIALNSENILELINAFSNWEILTSDNDYINSFYNSEYKLFTGTNAILYNKELKWLFSLSAKTEGRSFSLDNLKFIFENSDEMFFPLWAYKGNLLNLEITEISNNTVYAQWNDFMTVGSIGFLPSYFENQVNGIINQASQIKVLFDGIYTIFFTEIGNPSAIFYTHNKDHGFYISTSTFLYIDAINDLFN